MGVPIGRAFSCPSTPDVRWALADQHRRTSDRRSRPARVYSRDFGPDTGCNASDIVSTGTPPCWRLTRGPAAPRSDCQSVGAYQRAVTRPCRLWSGFS